MLDINERKQFSYIIVKHLKYKLEKDSKMKDVLSS